ncbi:hypothetical protein HYH03_011799 [Edaphochlamys debaryana]|uniref:Pherophorin domain-containing protein n=1 Tax=Edaphochlamys debaryana TaxID=47281 RepID=A0A835XTZ9_9CHLO|nr:hypothetical protein HYH03_011799 [Edaphochlamys debaryana]|eukprot:KAG2489690.1 hypothetical protein HYH03_011799 [Edaphochlamys debaryana]
MRGVCAVALLALVAAANAQSVAFTTEPFPYASCTRALSTSVYNVASAEKRGPHTICWTLDYNKAQCTKENKCCHTDVWKFELDIKPSCNVQAFEASATLDGVAIRDPDVRTPPNANPATQATLFLNGLGLAGPDADGKVLCITLEAGPCMTLESLIPDATWTAALGDSTHKCCPVSRGGNPSPPPSPPPPHPPPPSPRPSPPPPSPRPPRPPPPKPRSPPPPRPPPPSPPPTCSVCYVFQNVGADGLTGEPYFDDVDNCAVATEVLMASKNDEEIAKHVASGFDKVVCDGNKVTFCGVFKSVEDGQAAADYINDVYNGAEDLLRAVYNLNEGCPVTLEGQTMFLTSEPSGCGELAARLPACAIEKPPFPTCPSPCNENSYSTQFFVGNRITTKKGNGIPGINGTTYYCAPVLVAAPVDPDTYCGKSDVLAKVEFYLDWSRRWKVKSIAIVTKTNSKGSAWPVSWGPKEINTLKVTGLAWTSAWIKANAPQICFEIKEADVANGWAGTLDALAPADASGRVWTSCFEPDNRCCPVYSSNTFNKK